VADPMPRSPSLTRMSNADFEVAPNEPDVRGWSVVLGNDEAIGEVDDLIIDPSAGKVRYLDVDLDTQTLGLDCNRHVLVPVSNAQLDREEEEVVLSGMSRAAVLKLPEYAAGRSLEGMTRPSADI
jgi:photosynthetic reaction center H subunit